jgi:hypothetical protein
VREEIVLMSPSTPFSAYTIFVDSTEACQSNGMSKANFAEIFLTTRLTSSINIG